MKELSLLLVVITIYHTCKRFFHLNAGYTVSVHTRKLNTLVLLTLTSAEESTTCILHEGVHTLGGLYAVVERIPADIAR